MPQLFLKSSPFSACLVRLIERCSKSMDWPPHSRFFQFQGKHLLAVDFGEKVTGLSHFTPGNDPFPLLGGRIIAKSQKILLETLERMVIEENIDAVVLGIPYCADGQISQMAQKVLKFSQKLKDRLDVPVYTQNEALSTFEACERMKANPRFHFQVDPQHVDEVAATIILEDFLKSGEDFQGAKK